MCENAWEQSQRTAAESATEFYEVAKRMRRWSLVRSILIIAASQVVFILLAQFVLSFFP